jgi:hypothetical protein
MSGGSLDYVYFKVEEASERIGCSENPLHRAFADHLVIVSEALKAVEWNYSGDTGEEPANLAIRKVLGDSAEAKALDILKQDAQKLIADLEKYINHISQ